MYVQRSQPIKVIWKLVPLLCVSPPQPSVANSPSFPLPISLVVMAPTGRKEEEGEGKSEFLRSITVSGNKFRHRSPTLIITAFLLHSLSSHLWRSLLFSFSLFSVSSNSQCCQVSLSPRPPIRTFFNSPLFV